ncbi:MAG TPA: helix-hairpin-helix domain-containing protein [Burkholderiaceae bacterium]|nr:helix-hairpin-helix domain-containing protein [Burkholderiaceae bacterium]
MRSVSKPTVQRCAIRSTVIVLVVMTAIGISFAADSWPAGAPAPVANTPTASKKAAPVTLVDINSASRAQLKTLPGIGDEEASRIIAGRPYLSKADLATKNVIPTGVYLSLKRQIIAIQTQEPKAKN